MFNDTESINSVWSILVECAGASKSEDVRHDFVYAMTRADDRYSEYRFQGSLGFGGKFWRTAGYAHPEVYVTAYPEDQDAAMTVRIDETNARLKALAVSLRDTPSPKAATSA